MKKILFDTNIILDIALKRDPFFEDAYQLFDLIDKKVIIGGITASTITDIYYISKKEKGHIKSIEFISGLIEILQIAGIDKEVIINALNSSMHDFEDAIQVSASEINGMDIIITRNKSDFQNSTIPVNTPKEFLATH